MVSIGVDYYPEHWDRELWRSDAEMMKKTGVRTVRMGEFAWSVLEPEVQQLQCFKIIPCNK